MDHRIVLLADVTMRCVGRVGVWIGQRERFKALATFRRRENIGRGENGLTPQGPDSSFLQDSADALGPRRHAFTLGFFNLPPSGYWIGIVKIGDRPMETFPILSRKFIETFAVGCDPLQQLSGSARPFPRESVRW